MDWQEWVNIRTDVVSLALSIGILFVYHVFVRYQVRRNAEYTLQSIVSVARVAWTKSIMADRRDVLAVQTLRNSTMAATFHASTSVLLIIGVLTLSAQSDKLGVTWHVISSTKMDIWLLKLILLLLDLVVAFFSFSMSLRFYNHVGYMINAPLGVHNNTITPDLVAAQLNRAGRSYGIGMRAYFYLIPLLFWLFTPYLMLAATFAMVFALYEVDHISMPHEKDGQT